MNDFSYLNVRGAAERAGTSEALADQAGQIAFEAQRRASEIAQDRQLSVDERRRRVQELQSRAEAELTRALGDKAARAARHSLGMIFSSTSATLRP